MRDAAFLVVTFLLILSDCGIYRAFTPLMGLSLEHAVRVLLSAWSTSSLIGAQICSVVNLGTDIPRVDDHWHT